MHMWHCDVTYDVTASLNDVTLTNKMCFRCSASEVCLSKKWPKTAINDMIYVIQYTQGAGYSM